MATYTVKKGDTLWAIAKANGTTYQKLGEINGIAPPYTIRVGQVLQLTGTSSGTTPTPVAPTSNVPSVSELYLQSNSDNVLFVEWTWHKLGQTAKFKLRWTYSTGDSIRFGGISEQSVDPNDRMRSCYATYTIPSNAITVYFKVLPIAENQEITVTNGGVDEFGLPAATTTSTQRVPYFTSDWSREVVYHVKEKIQTPSAPTNVDIKDLNLTVSINNIPTDITGVKFQTVKDNMTEVNVTVNPIPVKTRFVSYTHPVAAGSEYKVRCKYVKGSLESEWSDYSDPPKKTRPNALKDFTLKALSENSVLVDWDHTTVKNAKTFETQYTKNANNFDTSAAVQGSSVDASMGHDRIEGLETGTEYFFRVRAVNDEGESPWTNFKSIKLGKAPAAPTTWSSTTTAVTGESVTLYWVHNSEDGSSQTSAYLEIAIDGGVPELKKIANSTAEDEKDKVSSYVLDTSGMKEGAKISWRVKTAGVLETTYGDWSIPREIEVYAPPTLELSIRDANDVTIETLRGYPFYIYALAGPNTQAATSYHISIVSKGTYEDVDNIGEVKMVKAGDSVYSKHFDTFEALLVEMSANNVNLENGITYTITCTVSMNSGLTAEASKDISVKWYEESYAPNAEVTINQALYSAMIRPYCKETRREYRKVVYSSGVYTTSDDIADLTKIERPYTMTGELVNLGVIGDEELYYCALYFNDDGESIEPVYRKVIRYPGSYVTTDEIVDIKSIDIAKTLSGETVLLGMNLSNNGEEVLYCQYDFEKTIEDVSLAVYRKEFDGTFTEVVSGLDNTEASFVIDPHPALDYARYRIVSTANKTGAISFYDVPAIPVGCTSAIIQWDEMWSKFDTSVDDFRAEPSWVGSFVVLPYNIDVTESNSLDVAHIKYAGRKHPVGYHGTHLGTTSTWNVVIPKSDKDTLHSLRKLSVWTGNVYVREPSGTGYWATVSVSFSLKHKDLTIPVTISITRVEGGV